MAARVSRFLVLLALLANCAVLDVRGQTNSGASTRTWYPCAGTNIRYLFDDSFKGIFNAAVAHCNNMPSVAGTTIAVPQSLTEDTCLYGIRPGDGKGLANWIGVRKIGGVWRTFDNRTLIYTNWRSAANPSNDCAVTYPSPSEKGQWNKIDCTSNTRHTVCERVSACAYPTNMTVPDGNAKVNGTSGDLVLSCNDGLVMTYSTLGNVSVRVESPASVISACQSGKWSVDLSSVVCFNHLPCPSLPGVIANGTGAVVSAFNASNPGTARYTCSSGYCIDGISAQTSRLVVCSAGGKWSEPVPVCTRCLCPLLPWQTFYGMVLNGKSVVVGSQVTFTCPQTATIQNGATTLDLTCQEDGIWDNLQPTCISKTGCAYPRKSTILAGKTGADLNGGLLYSCMDNFILQYLYTGNSTFSRKKGVATSRCSNGQWDIVPSSVFCSAQCKSLPLLTNGRVHPSVNSTIFTVNDTVKYECDPGYFMSSGTLQFRVLACNASGGWNDTAPSSTACVANTTFCPAPTSPMNGKFVTSNKLAVGSVLIYTCNLGYQVGPNIPSINGTCQMNGTWTIKAPKCSDQDECMVNASLCNTTATWCVNTDGSYQCSCRTGYTGDGLTCSAVCKRNCLAGQGVCSAPDTCRCTGGYSGRICENRWPQVTLIQNADVSADDRQRASRPTVFKVIDGDYHPGRCAFRCFTSTATYTYAGMFNGTQCFCESTVQGISQSSSVGKPCLGAPDFQCGNNGLISIYQLKTLPPSSLTITSNSIDTVLGRSTSQLPTFYVVAGGTLSLLCSATGSPLTFTWYQTNQLLPGETSASLTISSSRMSNAGTYKCLVTNKNVTSSLNFTIPSSKSVEITVIVQNMPVAQVPSKSYSLLEGEALAILCRMPGKPAQITWSKLSGTLPPYAQSKDGQLLIDKVKLSDAGKYRCTATDDDIEDDRKRNATTDVMVDIRAHSNTTECVQHVFAYTCQCAPGFTGDPTMTCVDVDECKNKTIISCPSDQICQNRPGFYTCVPDCQGDNCEGNQGEQAVPIEAVVGGIGGVVIVGLVIVLICFICKRRTSGDARQARLRQNSSKLQLLDSASSNKDSEDANGGQVTLVESRNLSVVSRQMFQNTGRNRGFGKAKWSGASYMSSNIQNGQLAHEETGGFDGSGENHYDTLARDKLTSNTGRERKVGNVESTYASVQTNTSGQPLLGGAATDDIFSQVYDTLQRDTSTLRTAAPRMNIADETYSTLDHLDSVKPSFRKTNTSTSFTAGDGYEDTTLPQYDTLIRNTMPSSDAVAENEYAVVNVNTDANIAPGEATVQAGASSEYAMPLSGPGQPQAPETHSSGYEEPLHGPGPSQAVTAKSSGYEQPIVGVGSSLSQANSSVPTTHGKVEVVKRKRADMQRRPSLQEVSESAPRQLAVPAPLAARGGTMPAKLRSRPLPIPVKQTDNTVSSSVESNTARNSYEVSDSVPSPEAAENDYATADSITQQLQVNTIPGSEMKTIDDEDAGHYDTVDPALVRSMSVSTPKAVAAPAPIASNHAEPNTNSTPDAEVLDHYAVPDVKHKASVHETPSQPKAASDNGAQSATADSSENNTAEDDLYSVPNVQRKTSVRKDPPAAKSVEVGNGKLGAIPDVLEDDELAEEEEPPPVLPHGDLSLGDDDEEPPPIIPHSDLENVDNYDAADDKTNKENGGHKEEEEEEEVTLIDSVYPAAALLHKADETETKPSDVDASALEDFTGISVKKRATLYRKMTSPAL